MTPLDWVMTGAIACACVAIGLFFLRFWRNTRDGFFLCFAISFWLEALGRVLTAAYLYTSEDQPLLYLLRLAAYGLIIAAIWQKNRPGPGEG